MEETKNPLVSLTIQGAIISALPVIGNYFKIDFGDVTGLVQGLVALVGLAMTVWGRIRAVKKIAI